MPDLASPASARPVVAPVQSYQPTSRRPIAAAFRRTASAAVRFCVRHDVHPDTVSYASIGFAAAEEDKGVLVILDNRLITKTYGKTVLKSLPPVTRIKDLREAIDFLK